MLLEGRVAAKGGRFAAKDGRLAAHAFISAALRLACGSQEYIKILAAILQCSYVKVFVVCFSK